MISLLLCFRSDNYERQEPLVHSQHGGGGGLSDEVQVIEFWNLSLNSINM